MIDAIIPEGLTGKNARLASLACEMMSRPGAGNVGGLLTPFDVRYSKHSLYSDARVWLTKRHVCRGLKLLSSGTVAIDCNTFKAVNSRDRNYAAGKIDKRQQQIEESVQRYLDAIEMADWTSPTGFDVTTVDIYGKIARLRQQMRELDRRPNRGRRCLKPHRPATSEAGTR